MEPILIPALTAIIDYATALRDDSDSSIDLAQLEGDAIFDLLDADDRDAYDDDMLPAAIDRDALDDLDRAAYDDLLAAFNSLNAARP